MSRHAFEPVATNFIFVKKLISSKATRVQIAEWMIDVYIRAQCDAVPDPNRIMKIVGKDNKEFLGYLDQENKIFIVRPLFIHHSCASFMRLFA